MKYLLSILFSLICFLAVAQPVQPRAGALSTVQDVNLFTQTSFKIPVFQSLSLANAATSLDSAGKLIFVRDSNAVFYRSNQHTWVKLGSASGGSATPGGTRFSIQYNNNGVFGGDTTLSFDPFETGNYTATNVGDYLIFSEGRVRIASPTADNKSNLYLENLHVSTPTRFGYPIGITDSGEIVKVPSTISGDFLVSVDSVGTLDSTVTYYAPIVYVQNGITFTENTNQVFTVNTVPSGYNRTDAVYIDIDGSFQIEIGQSDTTLTSPPAIPPNAILVGYITINGSVVTASPPATGVNYWTQGGDTTLNPFFGSKNNVNVAVIRNNIPQFYLEPTQIKYRNSALFDSTGSGTDINSFAINFRAGVLGNQTGSVSIDGSGSNSFGGILNLISSGSMGQIVDGSFGEIRTNTPELRYIGTAPITRFSNAVRPFTFSNYVLGGTGTILQVNQTNAANVQKPLVKLGADATLVLQDSINGAAASSAQVDIRSTSKGILIPRMTGVQMNAISAPTTGTLVQCTDSSNSPFCYYTGSGWRKLLSSTGGNATFTGVTDVIVDTATNTICVITTTATNCYPLSGDSVRIVGDTAICIYTNGSPDCYESNGDTLVVSGGIDSFTVIGNVACAWDNGSSICFNINNSNGYVDAAVLSADSTTYDFYSGSTYLFSLPTLLRNVIAGNSGIYISDTTISGNPYTVIYNTGSGGGSGWSLTGNAGTTAGTNFIGTTDAIDFVIKTNNSQIAKFSGSNNSINMGAAATASGSVSTVFGINTTASGTSSFAIGQATIASATGSTATGVGTVASGQYSFAGGNTSEARALNSATFGSRNYTKSYGGFSIGNFSDTTDSGSPTTISSSNRIFQIGNGSNNTNRSNAMTVLQSGNVGIGTTTPDSTLTVVGGLHFDLPTKGNGKVLTSDANGNATWQTPSGGGISALTGDVTASGTGSVAATLATVNSNVGSFGSATQSPAITVNGKGLITAVSNTTITPAVGSITGLGTGVATWLATPSSANLRAALPDESGNGAALFQNGDLGAATGTSLALGSTLGSSAILDLTSTTKAFYKPRMTTAQMDAISSPAAGAEIYNTDEGATFTYSTDWGWESGGIKWRTKFGAEYFNDFLGILPAITGSISDGNLTTFTTGGAVTSLVTPPTNRQGVIELSTSTSATGRAGIATSTGSTTQSMILGGGRLLYEVAVMIPTLSTSGERYQLLAGLTSSNSGINISNGVMFLYDEGGVTTSSAASANWQVYTAAASSRTFTTTSVAVTAGQWYRLAAVVNAAGTSVGFYIDGTLVRTETATIPTAAIGISNQIFKSVGTTARTAQIDYIYFKQKYTTPK